MAFQEIDVTKLTQNPFQLIGRDWALVTAGTPEKYNTMTVSWGNMGVTVSYTHLDVYKRQASSLPTTGRKRF